jgi:hypothetical protein
MIKGKNLLELPPKLLWKEIDMLKVNLVVQLEDLRSSIVKECCNTLVRAAAR